VPRISVGCADWPTNRTVDVQAFAIVCQNPTRRATMGPFTSLVFASFHMLPKQFHIRTMRSDPAATDARTCWLFGATGVGVAVSVCYANVYAVVHRATLLSDVCCGSWSREVRGHCHPPYRPLLRMLYGRRVLVQRPERCLLWISPLRLHSVEYRMSSIASSRSLSTTISL
jgi:hypothetical protein